MNFENKAVIVTGGSAGIGAQTAILFSQHGANVVMVGRNETKLLDVAFKCQKEPLIVKADVTIEEDVKSIISKTVDAFGKIDVLINNAGIVRQGSMESENILEIYDVLMATNVRSVVNLTNLALPYLIESKGNIVNISSIAGIKSSPIWVAYGMSKAALNSLSQTLAVDLIQKGVRVNCICPGPTRTNLLENLDLNWDLLEKKSPNGKIAEPEEIADLIMYLASDKAKSITGVLYVCDNGASIANK